MRKAKLGGVEFTVVTSESITDSATVTDNPVEDGVNVSDHIKQEPSQLAISGIITGEYASEQFERIKNHKERGRLVGYIGRNRYRNMAIESVNKIYDKSNKEGFAFDVSLKEVRVSKAKKIVVRKAAPKSAAKKVTPNKTAIAIRGRGYIQRGDRGNDVRALQTELNKLGHGLVVDGIYGAKTRAAVVKFQKKYKLAVDGVAGKNTIAKLNSLAASSTAAKKAASKTSGATNKGRQQISKR